MTSKERIEGVLLDLNGVLYVGNRLLPGAIEVVDYLKLAGIPHRFATNNSTESVVGLSQGLNVMGLQISPEAIISAPYAAVLYLRQRGYRRILPLLSADAKRDFEEFTFSETDAEAVVLGDMGQEFTYRLLNCAFKQTMRGAELIALHKGKFWQWEAGLQLDIGAFVTGLEYATDTSATLVGKPAASFFQLALAELELPPEQVIMVGDDVEADVGGAQAQGLKGILVKTGKYREQDLIRSGIAPDSILGGISELKPLLAQ